MIKEKRTKLKILNGIMAITLILFLCVIACRLTVNYVEKNYVYPLNYTKTINTYADKYKIDRALVYSVIKVESNFDERAESAKGAKGLMQITFSTGQFIASKLNKKEFDPYNPMQSIEFGCWYLRYLMDKFGSLNTVLCAYNAGEGNVLAWLKRAEYSKDQINLYYIPFVETREYVEKVNRSYNKYLKYHKKQIYS